MQELRFLHRYSSHFDRFVKTAGHYDLKDPIEAAAAGVHVVTQFGGLDPLTRDAAAWLDGTKGEPIPEYTGLLSTGLLPRVTEDTVGAVKDLFRGKPFSAVAKVINVVGDSIADLVDSAAGVDHSRLHIRAGTRNSLYRQMQKVSRN